MTIVIRLRHLILGATLAIGINAQGQAPSLKLRNAEIFVPANASAFPESNPIDKSRIFQGKYHLLIQFKSVPTQDARLQMEAMGLKFLEYLPDLTYIVAVPERFDLTRIPDVHGFMVPDSRVQLSEDIYTGNLPEWAMAGDEIMLHVLPYRGFSLESILPDLRSRYDVVEENPHPRRATVRVKESEIAALIRLPYVQFVEPIAAPSTPDDIKGRSLHRSNVINSDYSAGRHYDGTGVTIGLADDGIIGPHIDYTGRFTNYATANTGTHGDMTAGILFGAGNRDPEIRGHATGAYLHYWDIGTYTHIVDAVQHYNNFGMVLTSTSYSQGQGGVYTTDSEDIDDQIYGNPQMEHVFSAGNAGTSDHGYGAGAGWANITGGYKAAKSVITCGNLTPLGVLDATSSRGPADDGRIKPDICANGTDQLSTDAPNTNQVGGGTSAASPSVAGCVTQLYHAYKTLNGGNNPHSALIKACILNTGNDLGNPGPDYKHGWGHINSLRAVRTLEENRYLKDSLSQGQVRNHTLTVPAGTTELRVMVYWADYPGNPSSTKALVNDLDITVTNGSVYQPWVLNPAPNATTLNANATRGVDNLNNMEQVTITNPVAGTTTVTVNGTTVPFGPQRYFLVYEFVQNHVEVTYPVGGEGVITSGTETIRWDAYGNSSSFTLEYSVDGGGTWNNIASNVPAAQRYYTWNVPAVVTGSARVKVTSGSLNDQSDANFTIARRPTNLTVTYVCPDSIGLSWTAAAGSAAYEVSHLGTKYMDSTTVTTGTSAVLYGLNPSLTHWFSVAAITPDNGQGRRQVAIEHSSGVMNCVIPVDIELEAVLSPGMGSLPSCQASATMPVQITLRNNGTSAASNIPVSYSLNGGAPVNEIVAGPIAAGAAQNHTFATTINISAPGTYNLSTWATMASDGNGYNDTLSTSTVVTNASSVALPVTQNFESFGACGTASDCETEVCALGGGWSNSENLVDDDIDWRVDAGGTPSTNTGPDVDHNPGTASGKYVYLEASGCSVKEAFLMSPCIDLTGTTSPQATFWYHMYGGNMGTLHMDVLADGIWTLDAAPAITGDQGNQWRLGSVNLAAYVGKIVNIRWRGETGSDYESDMALDDIIISEANSAPIPSFVGSPLSACVGTTVSFTDMSVNNPTTWNWSISPANYNFVGGTTAGSQNPQVQFTTPGTYSVSMTAGNGFGSATSTLNGYITVVAGTVPAIVEDFSGTFTPTGWSIVSSGGTTWAQVTGITGASGTPTDAAKFDNYTYNNQGAEDLMITLPIDLSTSTVASVTFDVAYAEYNAAYPDGLRLDISTDCGVTWQPTGYDKAGPTLATAPLSTAAWTPTSASEWRNESVTLTNWVGNTVKLAFVNVNAYGNNIYVDNVNISSTVSVQAVLGTGWRFYPNPNDGRFTLEVDALPTGTSRLEVHDMAGRLLFSQDLKGNGNAYRGEIAVDRVPAGIYTLSLTHDGAKEVRKLTIR